MRILVVEDDDSVARFLQQTLVEAGYSVESAADGETAWQLAQSGGFDLILLDVMLPRLDGFEVCRRLRASHASTLVLIITARDGLNDKVEGLDSGADDYIVKPFQIAELLARMRALLRRSSSAPVVLHVADLTLDPATRRATRGDRSSMLSATEYALLDYLMRYPGRVLTRKSILQHVWKYDFEGRDNVLDVYISYLRSKIDRGHSCPLIHTVRGVGFRLGSIDAQNAT